MKSAKNGRGCNFELPRNIRQIGEIQGNCKLYFEDYALSFVKELRYNQGAVLLGCKQQKGAENYIFVSAAVGFCLEEDTEISFSNACWSKIYGEIKNRFMELEILGWAAPKNRTHEKSCLPGENLYEMHMENFKGINKILFVTGDEEESVFVTKQLGLVKQKGYYIYYEKNPQMEEYLKTWRREKEKTKEPVSVYEDDRFIKEEAGRGVRRILMAATTGLAVVVLFMGGTTFRNYDKMTNIEETLSYLNGNLEKLQNYTRAPKEDDENKEKSFADPSVEPTASSEVTKQWMEEIESGFEKEPESEEQESEEQESKEQESKEQESKEQEVTETMVEPTKEPKQYVVQKGDTLAAISIREYGTYKKIGAIKEANHLSSEDVIIEGQVLTLP
ncbi:MAG: LysM peptidoglycan-binding domain-containing protein [Lachnospiraceae bacterium]|nr:LysM peptidoglycan-binding domain-containing protein [Lachnospiraceae bacterium]